MTRTVKQAQDLIDDVRSIFPDAVRLATVVSLAVRVEPELLRIARLKLLPEVDTGTEADLWFSPLVQSQNTLAFVLVPEVEALLRQELAQDQTLLRQAWNVLKEVHQKLPPTICLEEEITWLALSNEPDTHSKIEQILQQVITAMVDEKRRGLAHWAVRALPRLPDMARTSQTAWILALRASAHLGGRPILTDEIPPNLNEPLLHWVMSTDNTPTIPVGVRLLENGIEFGESSMLGAHVIDIPATHPLLVKVSWWENSSFHTEQIVWLRGQKRTVPLNPEAITTQTAYGSGTYGSGPYGGIPSITIQTVDGNIYALSPYQSNQMHSVDVLLVTVTEIETMAVLRSFSKVRTHFISNNTYHDFGDVGGAKVFLVQSEMSSEGQAGSIRTIDKAIDILSPSGIVMVGIALGVDPTTQQIGDILVSQQILDYELQRIGRESEHRVRMVLRGEKAMASPRLLNKFRDGAMEWKKVNEPAKVQFGLILSGAKLVDNQDFEEQVRTLAPETIGGEMEGAGLYAVAQSNKVDWILVKAICDWADGTKKARGDDYQPLAAAVSLSLVQFVLSQPNSLSTLL